MIGEGGLALHSFYAVHPSGRPTMITATPAKDPLHASTACPSREKIFGAIQGECTQQGAKAIIKHASQCPACDQRWRDLCELSLEMAESVHYPELSAQLRPVSSTSQRPTAAPKRRLISCFNYQGAPKEASSLKLFCLASGFFLVLALFL